MLSFLAPCGNLTRQSVTEVEIQLKNPTKSSQKRYRSPSKGGRNVGALGRGTYHHVQAAVQVHVYANVQQTHHLQGLKEINAVHYSFGNGSIPWKSQIIQI